MLLLGHICLQLLMLLMTIVSVLAVLIVKYFSARRVKAMCITECVSVGCRVSLECSCQRSEVSKLFGVCTSVTI